MQYAKISVSQKIIDMLKNLPKDIQQYFRIKTQIVLQSDSKTSNPQTRNTRTKKNI